MVSFIFCNLKSKQPKDISKLLIEKEEEILNQKQLKIVLVSDM